MAGKHTPTPWRLSSNFRYTIEAQKNGVVAFAATHEDDIMGPSFDAAFENAAFIVRAVNNHEALMTFAQKVINVSAGGKDTVSLLVSLHDLAVEALKVVSDAEGL